jgi:hypothetical protein
MPALSGSMPYDPKKICEQGPVLQVQSERRSNPDEARLRCNL